MSSVCPLRSSELMAAWLPPLVDPQNSYALGSDGGLAFVAGVLPSAGPGTIEGPRPPGGQDAQGLPAHPPALRAAAAVPEFTTVPTGPWPRSPAAAGMPVLAPGPCFLLEEAVRLAGPALQRSIARACKMRVFASFYARWLMPVRRLPRVLVAQDPCIHRPARCQRQRPVEGAWPGGLPGVLVLAPLLRI